MNSDDDDMCKIFVSIDDERSNVVYCFSYKTVVYFHLNSK